MPGIIAILATSLKLSGRPEDGDGGDGGEIRATGNPMTRSDVLYMIKRRAKDAALPYSTCCHSFRATGITAYLQNGRDARTRPADRGASVTANHQPLRSHQV